jgi:two-component system chemotaxis sensor kinase CheA
VEAILGGTLKDPLVLRRQLHTLKGNAGVLGLDSVASLAHAMEDALEDGDRIPAGMLAALASRWAGLMKDLERILGSKRRVIEMDESQFLALEQQLRLLGPRSAGALDALHGLRLEPTRRRLEHFAEQARRIAQRLNKDVMVAVEDNGVRLDDRRWTPFWSAFIHAVRNAVDHGLEEPQARMSAGKAPHGKLTLRTAMVDGHLRVEVEDDGSGLNLERLVAAARKRGLEVGSAQKAIDLLFVDGVSTAESVTDLSGRGVGMGALKQAAQELGGVVEVSSKAGMGTLIRMDFPKDRSSASVSQAA